MKLRPLSALPLALLVAACTSPTIREPSSAHMMSEQVPATSGTIPQPITQNTAVPKPRATPKTETYSVVVNNVRVHDLLFALARDARINVDIHPGINGYVTLNAIDQTLPQLLNRIAKQPVKPWPAQPAARQARRDQPGKNDNVIPKHGGSALC